MLYLIWAWPIALILFSLYIVIGVVPSLVLRLFFINKAASWWAYKTMSVLARLILWFLNVDVVISGDIKSVQQLKKEKRRVCYVANHTSMLDILLVEGPLNLDCGFILKKQLVLIPFVNIMALAINSIFMNRKSVRRGASSIKRGTRNIENGIPMLIFPEGTRSKTGKIARFKHGSFKLATLSNSTVVPLTIKGIRCALEDRNKFFKHVNCYVNIGQPVSFENLDRNQIWDSVEQIENNIRKVYNDLPDGE